MANYEQEIFKAENLKVHGIEDKRFVILKTSWNRGVLDKLYQGAIDTLLKEKVNPQNIITLEVPGAYELPFAAQEVLSNKGDISAVIALGCIVRGETPHFDFIAQAVASGLMSVQLQSRIPLAFGVLTTENETQALERAGGKHGNKGAEAALSILQMLALTY